MPVIPLSESYRDFLVTRLSQLITTDPLQFVQNKVFVNYPDHTSKIPTLYGGRSLDSFYRDLIRYCELSAWAERPPLIAALFKALDQIPEFKTAFEAIQKEEPFQCHPPGYPYYVCLVAAELPLAGRKPTRAAALLFERSQQEHRAEGKRVLLVHGPTQSGKSYTLSFFRYLSAIQPLKMGVVDFDFGDQELATQAANANIPIELFIAQRLQSQVQRRRAHSVAEATNNGGLPDLTAFLNAPALYTFPKLSEFQNNRNRWAKVLANDFVSQVLFRINRIPKWWVIVFDNCEKAPVEAHEFIRRLVERAAGVDEQSAQEADEGVIRVVLLGDSASLMPNPVYLNHVLDENLNGQILGQTEVEEYFRAFGMCRSIDLGVTQIQELAKESLDHASEILKAGSQNKPPTSYPAALARAVLERTLALEALAAQKRSGE